MSHKKSAQPADLSLEEVKMALKMKLPEYEKLKNLIKELKNRAEELGVEPSDLGINPKEFPDFPDY